MTVKTRQTKEQLFNKADAGDADAMYSLGYRYMEGIGGLPKDLEKASEWFMKSAAAGSKRAEIMLKKLDFKNRDLTSTTISDTSYSNQITPPQAIQSNDSPVVIIMAICILLGMFMLYPTNKEKKLSERRQMGVNKRAKKQASKENSGGNYHMKFIALLCLLALAVFNFPLALTIVLVIVIPWWGLKEISEQSDIKKIQQAIKYLNSYIDAQIDGHITTLSLKRKQTLKYDDYGNVQDSKWLGEIDYFIDNVLKKDPALKELSEQQDNLSRDAVSLEQFKSKIGASAYRMWTQLPSRIDISDRIIQAVAKYDALEKEKLRISNAQEIDVEQLSPLDFEHYCADVLKAAGWQARVTKASGDQGIDVLADYNGQKAIFQCKKYSSPVGNKAVQEAIAGKQFAGASIAAVVSNASYTQSAQQLANTTGVYLLHYSELRQFNQKIAGDGITRTGA